MTETWDAKVKRVFDKAFEQQGAARIAFVNRECGEDAGLRQRILRLLAAAEKEDVFLCNLTAVAQAPDLDSAITEQPGARIGHYKLLEKIGEGGFGVVFMAEQVEPVVRRVALKIIKSGMDTRQVIARFEAERQALALMDHPNIARVLDAGATPQGRPYFVMELVRGQPVTDYCDDERLAVRQRLVLFRDVCGAVQHAHTKGIIHRDIKPSNILVTVAGGRPVIKVIDFGIAKACPPQGGVTAARLTDKTLFTGLHQLIGTPQYMSPEQAASISADIDTRSDVYTLGVVLYELLTGTTPFDARKLAESGLDGLVRTLREVDPPRPSARIQTLAMPSSTNDLGVSSSEARGLSSSSAMVIARNRRSDPQPLTRALRGDLDWIVMKCLEKERARRYETASALAADIDRFLAEQPVEAAPPGATYRLKKLVRRHRVGVVASGFVAASLMLGLGAAMWQARRAIDARNDADARRMESEQVVAFQAAQLKDIDAEKMGLKLRDDLLAAARNSMEREKRSSEEITAAQEQFKRLLGDVNLTDLALKTLDANIFDRAIKSVNTQFKDQPLIQARLLHTLAETMTNLGLNDAALAPLADALAIRRKLLGDAHRDTIDSCALTGILQNARGNLSAAESALREAIRNGQGALARDDRIMDGAVNNLGVVLLLEGKLTEAEPMLRESLAVNERVHGPEDNDTISAVSNLGHLFFAQGRLTDAEAQFRDALHRLEHAAKPDIPGQIAVMNNLASIIQRRGKMSDAESIFRKAWDRSRRTLGDDHPTTLQLANNVGFVLYLQDKFDESEPITRDTLVRRRRVLHDDHFDTMQSINNLGMLLVAQGKLTDAEPFLREALELRRRVLGPTHSATLQSECNLGVLLREQGKLVDAEPLLRDAQRLRQANLGEDHPDTLDSHKNMGFLLLAQHRFPDAEVELQTALRGFERQFGEKHADTAIVRRGLAEVLDQEGRYAESEVLLLAAESALHNGNHILDDAKCKQALVKLYEDWEAADPGQGHIAAAKQWRE